MSTTLRDRKLGGYVLLVAVLTGAGLGYLLLKSPSQGTATPLPSNDTAQAETQSFETQAGTPRSLPGRQQIRVGDPLFEPKTQAEADWLNRHDFPSQAEMIAAGEGEPDSHALDISKGISATSIIHAEHIAVSRPALRDQAMSYLNLAAVDGSIYALQALGRTYASGDEANPLRAEAYYRAAELRGDWNSALRPRAQLRAYPQIKYTAFPKPHQPRHREASSGKAQASGLMGRDRRVLAAG